LFKLCDVRKIIYFIIRLLFFYLLWLLADEYLSQFEWFKSFWFYPKFYLLKELVFLSTAILSQGLLYSVEILRDNQFMLDGRAVIEIGIPCIGHEIMYFYTIFIIAYPGPWKNKLYFILFGLVLINILNVFRIVALSLIFLYYPQYIDFNHHFLFTFLIYTVVFSIWLIWIKYFSSAISQEDEETEIIAG